MTKPRKGKREPESTHQGELPPAAEQPQPENPPAPEAEPPQPEQPRQPVTVEDLTAAVAMLSRNQTEIVERLKLYDALLAQRRSGAAAQAARGIPGPQAPPQPGEPPEWLKALLVQAGPAIAKLLGGVAGPEPDSEAAELIGMVNEHLKQQRKEMLRGMLTAAVAAKDGRLYVQGPGAPPPPSPALPNPEPKPPR